MKKLSFIIFCLIPSLTFAQISGEGAVSGSWTPAVTASSTAGTPAYTTQIGSYIQIGSFVYAQFNIVLSGWTGSPSGNVTITGLPLTSTSATNDYGGCIVTQYSLGMALGVGNAGIVGTIAPNATSVSLYSSSTTGSNTITTSSAGTTPTFIGFCNYRQ